LGETKKGTVPGKKKLQVREKWRNRQRRVKGAGSWPRGGSQGRDERCPTVGLGETLNTTEIKKEERKTHHQGERHVFDTETNAAGPRTSNTEEKIKQDGRKLAKGYEPQPGENGAVSREGTARKKRNYAAQTSPRDTRRETRKKPKGGKSLTQHDLGTKRKGGPMTKGGQILRRATNILEETKKIQ